MVEYPASVYNKYRPGYPPQLFDKIYEFHKQNPNSKFDLSLDIASGTGQTASVTSQSFKKVVAMDYSQAMLDAANLPSNVTKQVASAESFSQFVQVSSVDLITCSTAAHWFDMPKFYDECVRVLNPSGTVAIWGYGCFTIPKYPEVSHLILEYTLDFMKDYWDKGREYLDRMYSDPEFVRTPFDVFERRLYPDKNCDNDPLLVTIWTLEQIEGFLRSWSCYHNYLKIHKDGDDPVTNLMGKISKACGAASMDVKVEMVWPIVLLLAKKSLQ